MPNGIPTLHVGDLEAFYRQLTQIQIRPIQNWNVAREQIPETGGVYAFWWTGPIQQLLAVNHPISMRGSGNGQIFVQFRLNAEWVRFNGEVGLPPTVYVGKTHRPLRDRIREHILPNLRDRTLPLHQAAQKKPRHNTTCQLRDGIERLFPDEVYPLDLIYENVGISFVQLPGTFHVLDRCFLEYRGIGQLLPFLNVGVEH